MNTAGEPRDGPILTLECPEVALHSLEANWRNDDDIAERGVSSSGPASTNYPVAAAAGYLSKPTPTTL